MGTMGVPWRQCPGKLYWGRIEDLLGGIEQTNAGETCSVIHTESGRNTWIWCFLLVCSDLRDDVISTFGKAPVYRLLPEKKVPRSLVKGLAIELMSFESHRAIGGEIPKGKNTKKKCEMRMRNTDQQREVTLPTQGLKQRRGSTAARAGVEISLFVKVFILPIRSESASRGPGGSS